MDDVKRFTKKEKEFLTLILTVRIYSEESNAMLIMKCGKRQTTEGIEVPNQEKIRTLGEKETYK